MPANPKFLTTSKWEQLMKFISAAISSYFASLFIHLSLAIFVDAKAVFVNMYFTLYLLWCVLAIVAYLFKSGWKSLVFTSIIALVFYGIMEIGKLYYPIVIN